MFASKTAHGRWRKAWASQPSRYHPRSPSGPVGNRSVAGWTEIGYAKSSARLVKRSSASHVSRRGHHGCGGTTLESIGAKLYHRVMLSPGNAEIAERAEIKCFSRAGVASRVPGLRVLCGL